MIWDTGPGPRAEGAPMVTGRVEKLRCGGGGEHSSESKLWGKRWRVTAGRVERCFFGESSGEKNQGVTLSKVHISCLVERE